MNLVFSFGAKNDKKIESQNINIRVYHNSFDFRRTTYLELNKTEWDFDKQTLKKLSTGIRSNERFKELQSIEDSLLNIQKSFDQEFAILKRSQRLKSFDLKQWRLWCEEVLNRGLGIKPESNVLHTPLLTELFEEFIQIKLTDRKHNTIKGYKSNLNVLKCFMDFSELSIQAKLSKKQLSDFEQWYTSNYGKSKSYYFKFNETDLNFYRLLREWNNLKGNNDNYFYKIIANIKAVLNYFYSIDSDKYIPHKHIKHPDFKSLSLSPDHDILNEDEIDLIYNYKGKPYLENVRDLAIIQYHTCTRWSELKNEIDNLLNGTHRIYQRVIDGKEVLLWDIKVEKTEKHKEFYKSIPVHKRVLDIINRESTPRSISIQNFNGYIKELLRELNIDKTNSITSHTWRRSFITNMVNKGFSQNEIMQYSGHKDERSFRLYCQRHNVKFTMYNSIPTE